MESKSKSKSKSESVSVSEGLDKRVLLFVIIYRLI